jgi:hypothetical protein
MADITKCEGIDCPLKENCYRFTANDNEYRQSYFMTTPIKNGECDHFWEDISKQDLDKNKNFLKSN